MRERRRILFQIGDYLPKCHNHNGITFDRLFWKYFVICEICGKLRLRRRGEVFWTATVKVLWPEGNDGHKIKVTQLGSKTSI